MNTQIKSVPEADLIHQLSAIRQALTEERQTLLARVATIDDALGMVPTPKKTSPANPKTQKSGSIKEAVSVALAGSALSMKEIQALLSEHSPKSVESVVHSLVSAGLVKKDASSTPKKFSLTGVDQAKTK